MYHWNKIISLITLDSGSLRGTKSNENENARGGATPLKSSSVFELRTAPVSLDNAWLKSPFPVSASVAFAAKNVFVKSYRRKITNILFPLIQSKGIFLAVVNVNFASDIFLKLSKKNNFISWSYI